MKTNALKRLLRMDGPLLSIVSLVIAIVISAIIMAVCGYNPFEAYGAIVKGSFGSQRAIVQTLTQATPLIFTGLAFTLAKKANPVSYTHLWTPGSQVPSTRALISLYTMVFTSRRAVATM